MRSFRNFRLIPLVLAAIICLAGLKIMGLVLNGGYIFDDREISPASRLSWAQDVFNFPSDRFSSAVDSTDVTGSVEAKKGEASKSGNESEAKSETKAESQPEDKNNVKPAGLFDPVTVVPDQNRPVSAAERAILERLQERRKELETRAREIDIRENLLKAAEKRIDSKVEEEKALQERIGAVTDKKSETDAVRFKGIVTMYENMKPKDAARIFDRLDMSVLIEVASQIAPRKLSDIVGLMQPEAADRLTVEMARRAGGDKTASASASDLPKIEGKATIEGSK